MLVRNLVGHARSRLWRRPSILFCPRANNWPPLYSPCCCFWTFLAPHRPPSFGSLKRLIAVDLTDNQLKGPLPPALAQLQTVNTAYFDGNRELECPVAPAVEHWLGSVPYHAEPCV